MFAEDLDVFLSDFGEPVTLAGATVQAIFDRAYRSADAEHLQIEDRAPVLTCKDADLPADPHDETVVIRGASWLVIGVEPDGTGLSRLKLRKL